MTPGIWQILIVLVLVLLLFGGRGKISSIMGDLAKGITSFRKGLKDDEADKKEAARLSDGGTTIDVTPSASASEQREAEARKTAD